MSYSATSFGNKFLKGFFLSLILATSLVVLPTHAATIEIDTCAELENISADLAGDYIITADIDCSGIADFTPIDAFTGTLDGRGYTITDFSTSGWNSTAMFSWTNGATIENFTLASPSSSGNYIVGILIASASNTTISNIAITDATLSSSAALSVSGGIAGQISASTVEDCFVDMDSYIAWSIAGGLVGGSNNGSIIRRSYSTGTMTTIGDSGFGHTGGLVGINSSSSILNSYSSLAVTSFGDYVGGLVGRNNGTSTITLSYAVGAVSGSGGSVGGLVGGVEDTASTADSYWDTETTTQGSSAGGTAKNTSQMKTEGTFTSWDFDTIWEMPVGAYPALRNDPGVFDGQAPTVSTFSPADEESGVNVSNNLVITFNEVVNRGTGNITIKRADGTTFASIDVTSGQVTGTGTTTITINPTANLEGGTHYYLLIPSTAFEDASVNAFAGIASTTTWNFSTAGGSHRDVTRPQIHTLLPENSAVEVDPETYLEAYFTEPVYFGLDSQTIEIRHYADGSLFEAIPSDSNQVQGYWTNVIRLTLKKDLLPGVKYYVVIPPSIFKDTSGNFFLGLSDKNQWNFEVHASKNESVAIEEGTEVKGGKVPDPLEYAAEAGVFDLPCTDISSKDWAYAIISPLFATQQYPIWELPGGEQTCRAHQELNRGVLVNWLMGRWFGSYLNEWTSNDEIFKDISIADELTPFLSAAVDTGVIGGYPDKTFRANVSINRAELLKVLFLAFHPGENPLEMLSAYQEEYPEKDPAELFTDVTDASAWYYPYLYYATVNGYIEGRTANGGKLAAMDSPVLYAEAAKLIQSFANDK